MYYIIPTKKGLGIELWGSYDDLRNIYEVVFKFWNNENYINKKGFDTREDILSGFSFLIRKGYEGSMLKRTGSHFSPGNNEYFGCQISWTHFIFSLAALRFNMKYSETNKFDISTILQLEYWLENSMKSYDKTGATQLEKFIDGGIYEGNEFLYQFMRSINAEYFLLGGGKKAFRKLPELLKRGVLSSKEYELYLSFLDSESKRLNCKISNLELSDNFIDYDNLKW